MAETGSQRSGFGHSQELAKLASANINLDLHSLIPLLLPI